MSNSSQLKDVVLEVGERTGDADIVVYTQNGTYNESVFDLCTNDELECGTDIKNAMPNMDNLNGWIDMEITGSSLHGNQSFNGNGPNSGSVNVGGVNYYYDWSYSGSPVENQIIKFDMTLNGGGNPGFEGANTSLWTAYDYVDNLSINGRENTEQGRLLYLKPKPSSGFTRGISFEILEGDGGELLCRASGGDHLGDYLAPYFSNTTNPATGSPWTGAEIFDPTSTFFTNFTATISPYVHSAKWQYNGSYLDYRSDRECVHASYSNGPNIQEFASMVQDERTFGLRSSDTLFDCYAYQTNGWRMKLTISTLSNCKIKILTFADYYNGNGSWYSQQDLQYALDVQGADTSQTPWVWQEITQPGTYEVCVPYFIDTVQGEEQTGSMAGWPGGWTTYCKVQTGGMSFDYKVFYKAQYKFFEIEETGGVARAVIDLCEITNGGYTFGTVSLPTYASTTISVPTYTYDYLDIFDTEKVPLGLNFNSGDLRDPGKRSTGYSKTFELPASNRNQRLLHTMTADGSHRNVEDISWRKARIKANGISVFEGFARIEQSVTGQGGRYKCHILQDPSYWPELIGNKKLCELGLEPHEKNFQNVVDSWTSNSNNQNYVYPIINYGEWLKDSDPLITAHTLKDFHPAVYVRSIVDKMFEEIEYKVDSNFFQTEMFRKLIIPYTSGDDYNTEEGDALGEDGNYSSHASKAATVQLPTLPATGLTNPNTTRYFRPVIPCQTGCNHYSPGSSSSIQNGYTVPFTGRYVIYYQATVRITQGGTASNSARWAAWPHINGAVPSYTYGFMYGCSAAQGFLYVDNTDLGPAGTNLTGNQHCDWYHSDNSDSWKTEDFTCEMDLQQGDKVQMGFYGINFKDIRKAWAYVKDQDFMVYPKAGQAFSAPYNASVATALGCGMKQIDVLKGITELFNLYWTADNEAKIVYCEPYDDFYGSGKVIDWTQKIDRKSWSDKFLIDELAETVYYKYKEDGGDHPVAQYNEQEDTELWSVKITNDELYRKEEKEMGSKIFSPTFRMKSDDSTPGDKTFTNSPNASPTPIVPVMWKEDDDNSNWSNFANTTRPAYSVKFKPRILNYYGMSNQCALWKLTDDNGNIQDFWNGFPYAHTYNDLHAASSSYEDNLSWYNIPADSTDPGFQRGLFERYYSRLYEKISGGAALRSCLMDLTPEDIALFDFRDIIKIKMDGGITTWWTVNKIIDYSPGKDKLTKVELVEWKYRIPSTRSGAETVVTNYGGLGDSGVTLGGSGTTTTNNGTTVIVKPNGTHHVMKDPIKKSPGVIPTSNNLTLSILNPEPKTPAHYDLISVPTVKTNKHNGLTISPSTPDASLRNVIQGNGIALGRGLQANGNQVILGNHNKKDGSDAFQVGAGYYDSKSGGYVRVNAISVSRDGEFSVYGGEVVAEFTTKDGSITITGDVYYRDLDGNKKKVYLDKRPENKYLKTE